MMERTPDLDRLDELSNMALQTLASNGLGGRELEKALHHDGVWSY